LLALIALAIGWRHDHKNPSRQEGSY
jgi:hypothetical protein